MERCWGASPQPNLRSREGRSWGDATPSEGSAERPVRAHVADGRVTTVTRTAKVALGIGLGLGALAGITYFASEAWGHPRTPAVRGPQPGGLPGQIPPDAKNYIGSGWTGWAHKDVFPDIDAVVQAFLRLGYNVTDSLISAQSMAEVGRFQADHNLWWVLYGDESLGPVIQEYPADPGTGHLDEDELVGTSTIEALYDAMLADENFPGGWPSLVQWYEARA